MPARVLLIVAAATLAACAGSETAADSAVFTDTTAAMTPAPAATPTTAGGFMDPGAATHAELMTIPGIDSAAAAAIVAARPITSMTAVDRALASLGEAQRDTVYTRLWMPIDPNTASRDEIMLIPGVGAKMAHEFEEYRPWKSVEQFRREIGKYVDSTEVARLERYIAIKP